jgi:tetratricopeptide (TPR) repeat protein
MRELQVFLIAIVMTAEILAPAAGGDNTSAGITDLDPNAIVVLGYLDRQQGMNASVKWPRVAFAIGDGTLLLTAAHCVTDLQGPTNRAISTNIVVVSPYYGDVFDFQIVAVDRQADLAVLRPTWPSHPALALATEEEFYAAKQVLIASRPQSQAQSKTVLGDFRAELLPVLRVNERRPDMALQLKGTEQVARGWSGSPMVLPESGKLAGVLTRLRVGTFPRMVIFHYKRSDALGCSIRSVRTLLRKHNLEGAALRQPGAFKSVPDAQRGFSSAMAFLQALFSGGKMRPLDGASELALLRPNSVQAHLLLAFAATFPRGEANLREDERLSLAESSYKKALEIDPNNAYAHAAYAAFLHERGRSAEVLKHAEAALAVDPNNRLAQLERQRQLPLAQRREVLEKFIAAEPNDPEWWFDYSAVLLDLNRKDEALKAARKAVELDPNGLFYGVLANVLTSLGHIDEAEIHFKRMTERCGCQRCWCNYAEFLLAYRVDKLDEAEQAFKTAESKPVKRVAEKNMNTLNLRLLAKTSPQEAESLARRQLDADPNDAAVWWHLADILRTQTRYAEAVVAARKAVDLKPDVSYQPRLANCLAKAGEIEAAQQVYDDMLQRHPERGRYWYWYAEFLMDNQPSRLDGARQAIEKARTASDPNWTAPAEDMKKLQDRIDAVALPLEVRPQDVNNLQSSNSWWIPSRLLYSGLSCS